MSISRAIHPGRHYLVTRRCSERRFLMRPDPETTNAFVDCLTLAALKTEVSVVGVGTTSNHWHGVVIEPQGQAAPIPRLLS